MKLIKPPENFDNSTYCSDIKNGSIHIVGIEFDETASFRKGCFHAPNAIRKMSDQVETYSPYLDNDLENYDIVDLGNISYKAPDKPDEFIENLKCFYIKLFKKCNLDTKIITLGGEHSISIAPIVGALNVYPDLALLHLDAHADLRDGYQNYHYSHASVIRRASELFSEKNKLLQFGIRSGTKDEFEWMNTNGTLYKNIEDLLSALQNLSSPIYITLDLDFLDPSIISGTGTPEPGGETFKTLIEIFKILKNKNVIGADIVELSPEIDTTNNSTIITSTILRELILTLTGK